MAFVLQFSGLVVYENHFIPAIKASFPMIHFLETTFLTLPEWLWLIFSLSLGLCLGSFINVVIFRLPLMITQEKELSLSLPRSFCPACEHPIAWYDNLPCLSFLLLKARCRYCHTKISLRYFLIELFTGGIAITLAFYYGKNLYFFWALLFCSWMLPMIIIDLKYLLLPDLLTMSLLWLGLVINIHHTFVSLEQAVTGAITGYLLLATINYCYYILRRRDGMGQGDWKLLAAFGAWFGSVGAISILIIACLLGSLIAIFAILLRRAHLQTMLAFAPFLCIAATAWLIFNQTFLNFIHEYSYFYV